MDLGVFGFEVGRAAGRGGEIRGEAGEDVRAGVGVCGAGVVEGLGYADERFGGLEERIGVLQRYC